MTNAAGKFGIHGGRPIPEPLMNAANGSEKAYTWYQNNQTFDREPAELFNCRLNGEMK